LPMTDAAESQIEENSTDQERGNKCQLSILKS
jgi:hypothetical protein